VEGKACKRDPAAAAILYEPAAAQGDAEATVRLGLCFEKGRGMAQSEAEAAKRYAAASEFDGAKFYDEGVRHYSEIGKRRAPASFTIQIAVGLLALATRLGHAGTVEKLASFSTQREVASACCMGCGATRKLLTCGKCGVAVFCDRACQASLWRTHKPSCRQWRDEGTEEEEGEEEE